jgi:hypothetical protein
MKTARSAACAVVAVLLGGAADAQPPDWTGRYTELRGKSLGSLKQVSPNLCDTITAPLQRRACARRKLFGI